MMKKILCVALVVIVMMSLVACGMKLKGEYRTEEAFGSYVSYTFSGNKVTVKTFVVGVKALELEGTYEINKDGNEITITYDGDDKAEDNEDVVSGTQSFEKGDGYIKIGSLKLNLQG